jgi:hypothetical protein
MDDRKLVGAAQLNVIIETAEFAKEYHYFITVQLEGESEKRRTDISERVNNPQFLARTFFLPLPTSKIELNMRLIFQAFVVTVRDNEPKERGQARLLGECAVDLSPLVPALTDVRGGGTKQHLRFVRTLEDQQTTVGRFLVTLRVMAAQQDLQEADPLDIYHALPTPDAFRQFMWRVRVDFRSATDVPLNNASASGLASPYLEFGWSHYVQQRPGDNETETSHIIQNSRNPLWNYQLFYYSKENINELDGFFWVFLKERVATNSLESLTIPVSAMRAFHPVHFEVTTNRGDSGGIRCKLYFSLTIEQSLSDTASLIEELVDIAILGVNWSVAPTIINRIMIGMTSHGNQLRELPLIQVDLNEENSVALELSSHRSQRSSVFLSPVLPLTVRALDNEYGAQAIFTVPKSFLNSQVSFHLFVRDENNVGLVRHQMPETLAAYTEIVDDHLKSSLQ